jgi:hypothetical protein
MAYGDNVYKRTGIERQPIIIQKAVEQLKQKGYDVFASDTSLLEDMNDHVDYVLHFNDKLFHGKNKVKVDVKWSRTLTVVNSNGESTLQTSLADYFIFEVNEELHWYKKEDVKEWVVQNSYGIKNNKNNDGSKWICVVGRCPHEFII